MLGGVVPWLSPTDPLAWYTAPRNQPPSWAHILGTTSLGQDIFWLLALALRNSLILGVTVGFLATVIGVFLGLAAGYTGGWLDRVISFFMDALLCIPTLPILILMAALFGGQLSLPVIGIALLIFNWPYPGRQVRAVALTMREREFVNVAWFSGETPFRILTRHIFPYIAGWSMANFINTILVVIATEFGARRHRPLQRAAGDPRHDDLLGDPVPGAARRALRLDRRAGHRHRADVHRPLPACLRPHHALGQPEARPVIELRDAVVGYGPDQRLRRGVDGVSLTIEDDEIVGIAGEFGLRQVHADAGALRRFHPRPPQDGRRDPGRFTDPTTGRTSSATARSCTSSGGTCISYVPQGSMSVLNPLMTDREADRRRLPTREKSGGWRRCASGSPASSPASGSTPACSTPTRTSSRAAAAARADRDGGLADPR